jgi:hypothetical protein
VTVRGAEPSQQQLVQPAPHQQLVQLTSQLQLTSHQQLMQLSSLQSSSQQLTQGASQLLTQSAMQQLAQSSTAQQLATQRFQQFMKFTVAQHLQQLATALDAESATATMQRARFVSTTEQFAGQFNCWFVLFDSQEPMQLAPQQLTQLAFRQHIQLALQQLQQQQPTQLGTAPQHSTQSLITGSTCNNIVVYDNGQCQHCTVNISAPK